MQAEESIMTSNASTYTSANPQIFLLLPTERKKLSVFRILASGKEGVLS